MQNAEMAFLKWKSPSLYRTWSFYTPDISALITASLQRLHMKAAATDKKQRGGVGQSKAVLCVCLQCDNKGLTWPSPPSSACVVASKGPWSSSWKNQAGSLPPLQVRCEDEVMEMKNENEMKKEVVSDKLVSTEEVSIIYSIIKSTTEVFEIMQLEIRLQNRRVT